MRKTMLAAFSVLLILVGCDMRQQQAAAETVHPGQKSPRKNVDTIFVSPEYVGYLAFEFTTAEGNRCVAVSSGSVTCDWGRK
jgi:uncharacterized lipoprotein NlpE involved in copper resistance